VECLLVAVGMDLVSYYVPGAVTWLLHGGSVVRHRSWLSKVEGWRRSSCRAIVKWRALVPPVQLRRGCGFVYPCPGFTLDCRIFTATMRVRVVLVFPLPAAPV